MGDLANQIVDAEANLAALKREAARADCEAMGEHDFLCIGWCSAGCDERCVCSIPVYECRRCGACDYGVNGEAKSIMEDCEAPDA